MIVKAGPVRTEKEARMLRGADIVSVEVGGSPRAVGEGAVAAIRAVVPALALRVDLTAPDTALIERLAPDYLEFVAADPEKTELADRQLAVLARLGLPSVATGFYVAKDDTWLLDRVDHLERLVAAGVRYLQIELESVVDPGFRIGGAARRRLDALLARLPVLVTDCFTDLAAQTGFGETGVYLDLGDGGARPQTFRFPAAVRLLRGR